jgi:hypothetical protein
MIPIAFLLGMPFLAAAVLSVSLPSGSRFWLDIGAGLVVLAAAIGLIWAPAEAIPLLRHDRLGAFAAILVAGAFVASRPSGAQVARHLTLGGMLMAALSAHPLLTDAALALAVAAALVPHIGAGWQRVPLAGAGLGLLLFGSILAPAPLASGCALLGLATLAVAVPTLLPVLPLLGLRYAGPELVALGTVSILACGAGLLLWPTPKARMRWIAMGQAGVIGVAFGLQSPDATFAGLVLAMLLVLSQAACARAEGDGLAPLMSAAGLAGLPAFGMFAGLPLAIAAVAKLTPWLLVALLPGIAAMGWVCIQRLPAPRIAAADRWSAAWIPLVAAMLIGWFMPDPVAAWLHALAMELKG